MPTSSSPSELGGTSAAPSPRERRKPSSTRVTCAEGPGSPFAQTISGRPVLWASRRAADLSARKSTLPQVPNILLRCGRFQALIPVITQPRRSCRQATARAASASITVSISQRRSRNGSYQTG